MKRILSTLLLCLPAGVWAQGLTLPPSGGNQVSEISQHMGLVEVSIQYSSPGVTAPNGTDRTGQIWGQLVPYGLAPNNFGTAPEIPWRAGANMNTVFTCSHAIEVEGQPLPVGTYSLHMIPQAEGAWTLIFNRDHNAWGSYYYEPSHDQLRVEVMPEENPFHEDLTYSFINRELDRCTAALEWEMLRIPFDLSVPNIHDLYVTKLEAELSSDLGFSWQNWVNAATYTLQNQTHLEQGLAWADMAVSAPFIGQVNFTTLQTKAALLMALERNEEAVAVMDQAIHHPTANVGQIHSLGRQMIALGQPEKALEVFQYNAERHPNTWPVHVGLARGYSAAGDYKQALKHAKLAQKNVPEGDTLNANSLINMIDLLSRGEDVN